MRGGEKQKSQLAVVVVRAAPGLSFLILRFMQTHDFNFLTADKQGLE